MTDEREVPSLGRHSGQVFTQQPGSPRVCEPRPVTLLEGKAGVHAAHPLAEPAGPWGRVRAERREGL